VLTFCGQGGRGQFFTILYESFLWMASNQFLFIPRYMDFFSVPQNETVLFEKSATYFDQSIVPKRLSSLLPKTPIVVILIDPAKRAYSWYQVRNPIIVTLYVKYRTKFVQWVSVLCD